MRDFLFGYLNTNAKEAKVGMGDFQARFCFRPEFAGFLGLEQEIWTVDPQTKRLVGVAPKIFAKYPEGKIKPELPIHQLEINTDPCATVENLVADLRASHLVLGQLAREFGFELCFEAMPPSDFEVEVYPKPRYLFLKERLGVERLRNGWITSVHIHYGCRDLNQAIAVLNSIRTELWYLARLATGGCKSQRLERYQKMCAEIVPPLIESPHQFYEIAVDRGFENDPKSCWWGARINPQGTVEVRIFDNGPQLDITLLASEVKRLAERAVA